jgi:beta-barrel assembly-enhancing protease
MAEDNGQDPRGSSSILPRLLMALVIVLIGWFMYMKNVEENPVTGEKQHVSLSPSDEIRLGLESAPEMAKEMGGELDHSDPRYQEVQKIGNYVLNRSAAKNSPWQFQFHLLADDQTINAFALPGGQVFITLGLYTKLSTEAELAGVLSHEMGHVIERHTAQQMAKNQFGQFVVGAVGAAAMDPNNPQGAQGAAAAAAMVNQMLQLRYSRHDESQADIWGLKLMTNAGFDPRAMIQVMEILKKSGPRGSTPEIFQTHPNPDLRIEQIEDFLKENPPEHGLSEGGKLPQ